MFAGKQNHRQWGILLAVTATLIFSARMASAQIIINFDENGQGSYQLPNGPVTPLTSLGNIVDPVDPGNGLLPLAYDLTPVLPGFHPSPGDIDLIEPPAATGQHSDLLRWTTTTAGQSLLIVYSDLAESGELPDKADVGIPLFRQQPNPLMLESGVEGGLQGLFGYSPINPSTDPGWYPTPPGAVYNFTSDHAVPEPTSFALIGLGASLLLLRRRRR